MGIDAEEAVKSVERYNELCHKGIDEDFGKMSKRMFPVENPPYYACKFGNAGMLVMFGGLECDHELRVTKDGTNDPIPGLYVAGNTMGRRLLVDYPSPSREGASVSAVCQMTRPLDTVTRPYCYDIFQKS